MSERLRAVRGATTVGRNERAEIVSATTELLQQMLARNGAEEDDLVSVIFTSTGDLDAEFPAAAARELGISDVPLLCASEIPVRGSLERCVRVLMHLYTERERGEMVHVYLGDARGLRSDLNEL
jgi:chorismate mutase